MRRLSPAIMTSVGIDRLFSGRVAGSYPWKAFSLGEIAKPFHLVLTTGSVQRLMHACDEGFRRTNEHGSYPRLAVTVLILLCPKNVGTTHQQVCDDGTNPAPVGRSLT